MAQLLGIRIQNFKSLADVKIGRLSSAKKKREVDLAPVNCFIGRNGCGKSSLLDVFAFISDCLREGVEAACDKEHRGGFERLHTQGRTGPIAFTLYFRLTPESRPIQYAFAIDAENGIPRVTSEKLLQSSETARIGSLKKFLDVVGGVGEVWAGQAVDGSDRGKEVVRLVDRERLAIATYGQLADHPRIAKFREYLESWYLSYFVPGDARLLAASGAQRRLDRTGANLGNVLQYMERQHGPDLAKTLDEIAIAIPGVQKIHAKVTEDRRLLIAFTERGYQDPFYQYAMSDGTLKMFAYLLLLHDPDPPAFIGIEEPENGLYHKLHGELAERMRELVAKRAGAAQVLVTTHSPYFVDALQPEQVWKMTKQPDGTSTVVRAADLPNVKALIAEGIPLGSLWYSNELDED